MKSNVLNNAIGGPFSFTDVKFTQEQRKEILAGIFEQLLIFDKVTFTTGRSSATLVFLIQEIGINNLEKLLDMGYIEFILWSPFLFTSPGRQRNDGTIDESVILGQPPIFSGTLTDADLDPEMNIDIALSKFSLHRERRRAFSRKAMGKYIVPDGMLLAEDSANLVIDAYNNNDLELLGLPFNKAPEQLSFSERTNLLELGHKVVETAILSQYGLKSYENYEPYAICRKNLENIGKAYNIRSNTANLFKIENVPNLKQLFLTEHFDFDSVFKIRHLSNAKYFRKWINEVGEDENADKISEQYLNEIKGKTKFFEKTSGKLVKNLGSFGVNAAVGAAIAGPTGVIAGFALGLLETFWIDNILKGKNPSMFIDNIKSEIAPEEKLVMK